MTTEQIGILRQKVRRLADAARAVSLRYPEGSDRTEIDAVIAAAERAAASLRDPVEILVYNNA